MRMKMVTTCEIFRRVLVLEKCSVCYLLSLDFLLKASALGSWTLKEKTALEFYNNELSYSWNEQREKHNQRLLMRGYIAFCSKRGLTFHYSGSSSIFPFVCSLMLGWGIILESRKKVKVFVIAPGSKHTVGRCWETILHPSCQNTSALSLPRPWAWTHWGRSCQPSRLFDGSVF